MAYQPQPAFRVVILDAQGTLLAPAFRRKNGTIIRQHDVVKTPALQAEVASLPKTSTLSTLSGVTTEETKRQLHELADRGVTIYMATGDGREAEEGTLTAFQAVKIYKLPILEENIISWEVLKSRKIKIEETEGKNAMLQYIRVVESEKHPALPLQPKQMFFLDDGPSNVIHARELEFVAERIDVPQNLKDQLDFAIQNIDPALLAAAPAPAPKPNTGKILWDELTPDEKSAFGVKTAPKRKGDPHFHPSATSTSEYYWNTLSLQDQADFLSNLIKANSKENRGELTEEKISEFSNSDAVGSLPSDIKKFVAEYTAGDRKSFGGQSLADYWHDILPEQRAAILRNYQETPTMACGIC